MGIFLQLKAVQQFFDFHFSFARKLYLQQLQKTVLNGNFQMVFGDQ